MQNILQSRYYDMNERKEGNIYFRQGCKLSVAKCSGIPLPAVHGEDKE